MDLIMVEYTSWKINSSLWYNEGAAYSCGYRITAIMLPSQGRDEVSTTSIRTNKIAPVYRNNLVGMNERRRNEVSLILRSAKLYAEPEDASLQ